jgi:hypothetical protein
MMREPSSLGWTVRRERENKSSILDRSVQGCSLWSTLSSLCPYVSSHILTRVGPGQKIRLWFRGLTSTLRRVRDTPPRPTLARVIPPSCLHCLKEEKASSYLSTKSFSGTPEFWGYITLPVPPRLRVLFSLRKGRGSR